MENKSENIVNEKVGLIPVDQISRDPKQPRKTFDQQKLEELAATIKTNGMIQRMLLRPNPSGGYFIVCGERRHKAAIIIGLTEVPAEVRDIPDHLVREHQIMENLMREDVHPMEQAQGFLQMIQESQMNPDEIALRLGKTVYSIRRYLKLNDLTPNWQKFFLRNGISVSDALQLCSLPTEAQRDIYRTIVSKEAEKDDNISISISSSLLNKYKGDLINACFNIEDPALDPKKGSCIGCTFNSATSSLFPSEEKRPFCRNTVCFKNKVEIHLNIELEKAKADPNVVLVFSTYSTPDVVKKLKEEGHEVLKLGYGDDCYRVNAPEKPIWNVFIEARRSSKKAEKSLKIEFNKQLKQFDLENAKFEKSIKTALVKRAYVVCSNNDNDTGKYIFITLPEKNKKKTSKDVKAAISKGTASINDIDNQITNVLDREKSAKDRDKEKVHRRIIEAIKEDKNINILPKKENQFDSILLNFLLIEHLGWRFEKLEKIIKIPGLRSPKDINQFRTSLKLLSKQQISYIIKYIIMDKYQSHFSNTKGGFAIRLLAEGLGTIPIIDFENDQKSIAANRQLNVNKAVAILKENKAELIKNNKQNISKAVTAKIKKASAEKAKTATDQKRA
ncbi:ParB/RepB/Spo0J family partition protein [Chitinophaga niabensis]|uniref:ParB/RepB/Spo0J family partition protein n=1 Tax=Chitinophaga niabensis TaxID=536979 RepID=A0A1N6KBF8_9BACT|nr:ParB/RepB/Spo0J family partition protein [Chitinophaga niabensis]SIO53895.1 ParB/RepB/Spo0J family partition protein [Chitinophaga niabensis]